MMNEVYQIQYYLQESRLQPTKGLGLPRREK